jgi:uncharacterized protein YifN (PemK superfamily)
MPIQHVPHAGEVLICDFSDHRPPEMTKIRKVIMLTPRSRVSVTETFLVIPVSMTPRGPSASHCEFKPRAYLFFDEKQPVWALTDMVTCVARWRLNRLKLNDRFVSSRIRETDLFRIREAVLHSMGMVGWKQREPLAVEIVADIEGVEHIV